MEAPAPAAPGTDDTAMITPVVGEPESGKPKAKEEPWQKKERMRIYALQKKQKAEAAKKAAAEAKKAALSKAEPAPAEAPAPSAAPAPAAPATPTKDDATDEEERRLQILAAVEKKRQEMEAAETAWAKETETRFVLPGQEGSTTAKEAGKKGAARKVRPEDLFGNSAVDPALIGMGKKGDKIKDSSMQADFSLKAFIKP